MRLAHRQRGNWNDTQLPSIARHRRKASNESPHFGGRATYATENNQGAIDRRCNIQTIHAITSAPAGAWSPEMEDAILAGPSIPKRMRHKSHGDFYNQTGKKIRPVDTVTTDEWDGEPTAEQLAAIERELSIA